MNTHRQVNQDSGVGLLLLDSERKPVYATDEAIKLLAYPEEPRKLESLPSYLAERVQPLLPDKRVSNGLASTKEFISGRRHYLCRVLVLKSSDNNKKANNKNSSKPAVAILFERAHELTIVGSRTVARFHLTAREGEAVKLLLQGLTSKEIAEQMRISRNTVNTFLRLVMVKMGVSRRVRIIGKILQP
jgi:DNA-binding CsgD family transcriptional regulator